MSNASRAIAEISKAEVVKALKAQVMEFYQTLPKEQKQQYKETLNQVMQAETNREVHQIGKPIYLAMKKNKAQ